MGMRIYYQVMDSGVLEMYRDVSRLRAVPCPRLREVELIGHSKIPSILVSVFTLSEHPSSGHGCSHVVNNSQQSR